MHDLVIRGGTIVDGTGAASYQGDVAVDGDRIGAVGAGAGRGRREIDARGLLVAPGWVDIHTHYDGQATWDAVLGPSSWHGVTTVVMGNCGVGFAPARPDRHAWLIGLMEGVEDIPGTALAEGIDWAWESFPEYLDALERKPRVLDVGAQVPHGAVRAYVMGERGARNERATAEDLARMAAIVRDGVAAGALGFSTSRTVLHRAVDGEPVPGTFSESEEMFALGAELKGTVLELVSDWMPEDKEFAWVQELAARSKSPVTFAMLQNDMDPAQWRRLLQASERAARGGARVIPQVAVRPTGLLLGHQTTASPFTWHKTYQALAELPFEERLARLQDGEVRRRILAEEVEIDLPIAAFVGTSFHKMFPLGDPPDYEPPAEASVAAMAQRQGRPPLEVAYDLLLQRGGRELLYMPLFDYTDFDFEVIREMLTHPLTVLGLSDGGAHCGIICDASTPTFLLTHWVRDRTRGPRLPLEQAVEAQTSSTARLYGLLDRGVLAPGMLADINVIDLDALRIAPPEMVHDLPAGGRRLVQRVSGYRFTIKSGRVTFEDGVACGVFPGGLVRGRRQTPTP